MANETIKNLLEALQESPGNVPLRLHVAELMMNDEMYTEAGEQYRDVLKRNYGNIKAQLGLALITALKGIAYFEAEDDVTADPLLRSAVPAIRAALNALGDKPDGQRRILAIAHSYLGLVNWYHARIAHDKNKTDEAQSYDAAIVAFKQCIALDDGNDEFLKQKIATDCQYNLNQADAEKPGS